MPFLISLANRPGGYAELYGGIKELGD